MELKITQARPGEINFNYEELKNEIVERAKIYETIVYNEDQIKTAKADRAKLNKLMESLNSERIRLEKEYMQPFNEFKDQVNEIISIIRRPINQIDVQVKEYEESKKIQKRLEIVKIWDAALKPQWMEFEQIFNAKWLNSKYSLKSIEAEIEDRLKVIKTEVDIIQHLPEFGFECLEVYKRTLNLSSAMAESHRLVELKRKKEEMEAERARREETRKAEEARKAKEARKAEEAQKAEMQRVKEEAQQIEAIEAGKPKFWIRFEAYMDEEQAQKLGQFCRENNITIKTI